MVRFLLAISLFLLTAYPVSAVTNEETLNVMADQTIVDFIRPGYTELYSQINKLSSEMTKFCASPDRQNSQPEGLQLVRLQFSKSVLAYAKVEMIRFGPIIEEFRLERFFYWPDRKGRGRRAVKRILRTQDKSALDPDKLPHKSVAVQGLPALELVLYGEGFDSLVTKDPAGSFRCSYGLAIAKNLENIARAVLDEWQVGAPIVKQMKQPKLDQARYRLRKEVVQEIYQSIVYGFKNLHEVKMKPLLGKDINFPKPRRAAFWRSGMAVPFLRGQIDGLKGLVKASGFEEMMPANEVDLKSHVRRVYQGIYAGFASFSNKGKMLSIAEVVAEEKRRVVFAKIIKDLSHLNAGFSRTFAVAADLPLGFNAADGD